MTAPVEAGQILAGKYRVERVLGEGGMGVVIAAVDVQLERKVAIKFLLAQYSQNTEAAARFMREARAAVKIQSEHIARVIDVNTMENGSPYMVMEFLEGNDLSRVVELRGPLPVEDAVAYVLQASDAVAEAHAYGIVHRDLKPANLFLAKQADGSEKVKVLDFGISKNTLAVAGGTDPSLTRTSSMMGSPLYMSPEQMRSTKDVDARTDIWALGIILYELLTARLPFDAASIPELSAKILLDAPAPMARPDVPPELEGLVLKALTKDPNGRFPTIAEFSVAISAFGPKRTRVNVERISKMMRSAGLSQASADPLESIAPAAASQALPLAGQAAATTRREHAATVSEWGKTGGAGNNAKKSAVGLWLGLAAVALLGSAAAVAFFLLRGPDESAATAAAASELVAAPATAAREAASAATQAAGVEATGAEASPSAGAPEASPSTANPTASVTITEQNTEAPVGEASVAAPLPSANAPRVPAATKPRPVAGAPKPPPQAPTKKKASSGSIKDQFGGRK
jgi:eukaryotic-like serine/threonine-protein kinase